MTQPWHMAIFLSWINGLDGFAVIVPRPPGSTVATPSPTSWVMHRAPPDGAETEGAMTHSIVHDEIADHLPDLERFARWLVGGSRDVEAQDLVQDCVERALQRADQFEPGTNLRAWLMTMMRNIFLSRKRHEQVKRRYAEAQGRAPMPVQAPSQIIHVLMAETSKAIAALPPHEAEAIRELVLGEQPHAMLAERQEVPLGTIKSRLSRTRAKLRSSLGVGSQETLGSLAA